MTRIDRPVRPRRRRAGVLSSVTAATASAALIAVSGCSSDGNSASPHSSSSSKRPAAKPAPAWRTAPASLAALGDSITVGFDACTVLSDCPQVSWATGTDPKVDSLARRLVGNPATHSWNYARTGALMADLPDQVAEAVVRKPELVTVLIGANDACRGEVRAMTPKAVFRAQFETAVKKLRRSLPHTQVYVAAVPDLLRLWSEGRKNPLGKQVWKLGICGSMLRNPDDLTEKAAHRREKVRKRVMAYNAALKDVCGKDPLCRFDGAVFDYRFTDRQLSTWDWFHPGTRGQRELAALAFRTITRKE
ncbi:SGNH/GDSL hydrolase family protein [Streptomyces piniterrae]|uniref:SGNH/GDSL hydrolase family protein n=1 Tax=Streptomyces piniterrae TaxID=2571125 RepID=A0A4U0NZ61_9ACTN|nr:SGNH/GDSL hydrolase family protein [Streptomyces piniterrae]TJZ55664.1 SGNH/GDSL hydrolase family protein [Streptomyces piniterrae]